MNTNTSNITGNSNVVLQDINAHDVIINIASDLPPEVKQKKEELNQRVKSLADELGKLQDSLPVEQAAAFEPPDDPAYESIKWRRLLQALRHQGCVLFIGPEISVDDQGQSLHQEFYKELAEDFDDIEYLDEEGFFSPESDEEILYDVLDYYSRDFPRQNKAGRALLEKFAQVPFSLIISLCPDDTMRQVYEDFDLDHQFLFYDGTRQEIEPSDAEIPVIYNILGNASSNGRYIFTHENFFNYLNKVSIPSEIKKKIQDATHYLFIGFDFNKWYNRLLLFILDFEQKKSGANRLIVGNKNVLEDIEKFIEKQFNITFIDNEYKLFVEWLIANTRDAGIFRDLNQAFLQKNFMALKNISTKVSDEDKLEDLLNLESQVKAIGSRIEQFKQRIAK